MSDYELIMLILEVMTVIIAFGALVALIWLIGQKVCVKTLITLDIY